MSLATGDTTRTGPAPRRVPAPPARPGESWTGYWDRFAADYDDRAFTGAGLADLAAREVRHAVAALSHLPRGRVLDLGAGTGRVSAALAADGWSVVALDASPSMLGLLAGRVPGADRVLAQVGRALPFAPASFDALTCLRVMKYVDDQRRALAEVARVLRPGGVAVIEWAGAVSLARFGYRGSAIHLVTPADVERWARDAGLRPTGHRPGPRLPHPWWARARSERSAAASVAVERALARCLGGPGSLRLARSFSTTLERDRR